MKPGALRRTRRKVGLSQIAVAALARVSRFRLQVFEAGFLELTAGELARISRVLQQRARTLEAEPAARWGFKGTLRGGRR